MITTQIKNRVKYTIKKIKPGIDVECLSDDAWLTGNPYYFSPIDMAYLFFELEKHYKIKIRSESLQNYGFVTINGIAKAIQSVFEIG